MTTTTISLTAIRAAKARYLPEARAREKEARRLAQEREKHAELGVIALDIEAKTGRKIVLDRDGLDRIAATKRMREHRERRSGAPSAATIEAPDRITREVVDRERALFVDWLKGDGSRQRQYRSRAKEIMKSRLILLDFRLQNGRDPTFGEFAKVLSARLGEPWTRHTVRNRLNLLKSLEEPAGPWHALYPPVAVTYRAKPSPVIALTPGGVALPSFGWPADAAVSDESGKIVFGTDKPVAELDALAAQNISRQDLDVEQELLGLKWFDYRFMHPVQATYLFAHFFERQYRLAYAKHVDRAAAVSIIVMKQPDLFKCRRAFTTAIFRARQRADLLGLPYEFAVEAFIRHALTRWGREYLPRPNQIYADWILQAAAEEWTDVMRFSTRYAKHPHYEAASYAASDHQRAYRNYLVSVAKLRHDPAWTLKKFLEEGLLDVETIEDAFGSGVLEGMREAA